MLEDDYMVYVWHWCFHDMLYLEVLDIVRQNVCVYLAVWKWLFFSVYVYLFVSCLLYTSDAADE